MLIFSPKNIRLSQHFKQSGLLPTNATAENAADHQDVGALHDNCQLHPLFSPLLAQPNLGVTTKPGLGSPPTKEAAEEEETDHWTTCLDLEVEPGPLVFCCPRGGDAVLALSTARAQLNLTGRPSLTIK